MSTSGIIESKSAEVDKKKEKIYKLWPKLETVSEALKTSMAKLSIHIHTDLNNEINKLRAQLTEAFQRSSKESIIARGTLSENERLKRENERLKILTENLKGKNNRLTKELTSLTNSKKEKVDDTEDESSSSGSESDGFESADESKTGVRFRNENLRGVKGKLIRMLLRM